MRGTCQWEILRVVDMRNAAKSMGDEYPFQFKRITAPKFYTGTYKLEAVGGATPAHAEAALWGLMDASFGTKRW